MKMTFEEWWYNKEIEIGDEGIDTSIKAIKNLAEQSWGAARPNWQPIETAPTDGTMVRVGWLEDGDWYEDTDFVEDGVWIRHADHYDHFLAVGIPGMTGPKEESPYQYWIPMLPPPNNIKPNDEVLNG